MQYKLPIVSTDEGGIKDIVEDSITGYIVPKQNAGALAEKIAVLIDNEELRHNMGNAGYLRYKKYFTLSVFEHKMTDILNRIYYSINDKRFSINALILNLHDKT